VRVWRHDVAVERRLSGPWATGRSRRLGAERDNGKKGKQSESAHRGEV
jgi:hypothetical protein